MPQIDRHTLSLAIHQDDAGLIRAYLAGRGNPNRPDELGRTLLHEAAACRRTQIVELLLAAGARPDPRDRDVRRPLDLALEQPPDDGDPEVMIGAAGLEMLDPVPPAPHDPAGQLHIVRLLLDAGAEVNPKLPRGSASGAADVAFMTPLMLAAECTAPKVVALLLERGANVDGQDCFGATPLIVAVDAGRPEVVEALLSAGADVNLADHRGQTPLLRSIYAPAALAVEQGRGVAAPDGPARAGIEDRCLRITRTLLAAGADVEAADDRGHSPLFACVNEARGDLLELVLAAGADTRRRAASGETLLHFLVRVTTARRLPEPAMASLARRLVQAGADRSAVDAQGHTPLDLALAQGSHLIAAALA